MKKIKTYSVNNDGKVTDYTTNTDYVCFDLYSLFILNEVKIKCEVCNHKKEMKTHNYCPNCGHRY